ncbi:MAG: hypothetical protein K6F50_05025 [Kiritimatiellae bacterium]|nr:hypothetical protein [Kiritimatiellia bacterium]
MKLNASIISCLALAAAGGAAFADATTEITSTAVGVLKTAVTAETDAPLGVPYTNTVDKLVTVGVSEGAEISVWTGSGYKIWRYNGTAWVGAADANKQAEEATSDSASSTTVPAGTAVWFKPASKVEAVTLVGTPADSCAATPDAGETSAPKYSLMCNPFAKPVALAGIEGTSGDQIVVLGSDTNTAYTHNGTTWCTGKWTETTTPLGKTQTYSLEPVGAGATIPAGGFWYISKGGAPTIAWPTTAE